MSETECKSKMGRKPLPPEEKRTKINVFIKTGALEKLGTEVVKKMIGDFVKGIEEEAR